MDAMALVVSAKKKAESSGLAVPSYSNLYWLRPDRQFNVTAFDDSSLACRATSRRFPPVVGL
jgi:hypothetical protein